MLERYLPLLNFSENRHWLVWTLLPLVDWKKAIPFVQEHGLAGRFSPQRPDLRIETEGYKTEEVCQEIEAFAKSHWPEATDVLWLVNPVKLQSVPALVSRVDHTSYDYVGILADGAGCAYCPGLPRHTHIVLLEHQAYLTLLHDGQGI